jgi:hypothetical protein
MENKYLDRTNALCIEQINKKTQKSHYTTGKKGKLESTNHYLEKKTKGEEK